MGQAKRLKELEKENSRLKRLVAELKHEWTRSSEGRSPAGRTACGPTTPFKPALQTVGRCLSI